MAKYRVEGKVQVAVALTVEAKDPDQAKEEADRLWLGLNDSHTGKAVGVFDDDDLDPKICEDGSEPEWVEAEPIGDDCNQGE